MGNNELTGTLKYFLAVMLVTACILVILVVLCGV